MTTAVAMASWKADAAASPGRTWRASSRMSGNSFLRFSSARRRLSHSAPSEAPNCKTTTGFPVRCRGRVDTASGRGGKSFTMASMFFKDCCGSSQAADVTNKDVRRDTCTDMGW